MKRSLVSWVTLMLLTAPVLGETPEQREGTVAFLQKLQAESGGFSAAQGEKATLGATSSALRALKYFGGDVLHRDASAAFVRECWDKENGGFADAPGLRARVRPTAVGVMALSELKLSTEPYVEQAVRFLGENARSFEEVRIAVAGLEAVGKRPSQATDWLDMLYRMRNPDGTFGKGEGKARETGGATVAILRLGGKVRDPEAIVIALDDGQRDDHGFGPAGTKSSDLETTYRVLRCYHMLKAKPAGVQKVREFIARCRNTDGGYGVAPGKPSSAPGTYFAGIILHWLDEK